MIHVMTLATGEQPDYAIHRLPQENVPLRRHAPIDILCCQSIQRSAEDNQDLNRTLAQAFGLTCSCFTANRQQPQAKGRRIDIDSGLAIMTGIGVWMLNSGTFSVFGDQEGEEQIVQFALVRKNGASVLVLNLHIAASAATQRVQLEALFSHPLLKEQYGAVVLCTDRQTALSGKEVRALTTRSNYCLHHNPRRAPSCPGKGMVCLLTAREKATVAVTLGSGSDGASAELCDFPQPGLAIKFEMQRIVQNPQNIRPYLPLSFREQWLGGKEKYTAFAA